MKNIFEILADAGPQVLDEQIDQLELKEFGALAAAVFRKAERRAQAGEKYQLPTDAYYAKTRAFPTPFVEIVCVYEPEGGELELLLEQRAANDPYWPGQWCTQGITVMPRQSLSEIAQAHVEKECQIPVAEPLEFAGAGNLPRLKREHAAEFIFIRRLRQKPEKYGGTWFKVSEIPENFIAHMREGVLPIVLSYLADGKPRWAEYLGSE